MGEANYKNFASKREQCQTCLSIAEREQSQDRDSGINTTNFLKTKNKKLKTKTNGIIIPSKDAEALYEAMKMMIEDDAMRESMAKNARPMIESRFEQGFVRKCLYDFYEEVLLS